jgi:hypothetical protein
MHSRALQKEIDGKKSVALRAAFSKHEHTHSLSLPRDRRFKNNNHNALPSSARTIRGKLAETCKHHTQAQKSNCL